MIKLEGVSRSFQRADGTTVTAVDSVDLEIPEGEFVCVIGPSGCGKTTLLQLIAGLQSASGGSISSNGRPLTGPGPDRGVVFQQDSVFPWMRVIDNVEYGLKCRGVDNAERRRIARQYLDAVGLRDLDHSWPRELSGGMLKRVAVATVFANRSDVLLLDEPFGPLDYVTKRQLHDVLLRLWSETGADAVPRTCVFVTHDVDEALILADRILVMRSGRVVEDYSSRLKRPRTTDTLAQPDVLALKHALLRHLGLEGGAPEREASVA